MSWLQAKANQELNRDGEQAGEIWLPYSSSYGSHFHFSIYDRPGHLEVIDAGDCVCRVGKLTVTGPAAKQKCGAHQ
jgi:hypothetical protein